MQLVVSVIAPTRPIQRPVNHVNRTPTIGNKTTSIFLFKRPEKELNLITTWLTATRSTIKLSGRKNRFN